MFDSESNLILDELIEMNGQLSDSIAEYESLNKTNYELNSRLIELSDKLCSFSQMNKVCINIKWSFAKIIQLPNDF